MNIELLIQIAKVDPDFITDEVIESIRQSDHQEDSIIIANAIGKFNLIPIEIYDEVDLEDTDITSLGEEDTDITSLGELERVRGDLNLRGTRVKSLGKLEEVGCELDLYASTITSLGNLEYVGGYLNISGSRVTDLGNLEEVGCELDLQYTDITSLGKLKRVGLNKKRSLWLNRDIISLGELEEVGGNICCHTQSQLDLLRGLHPHLKEKIVF